MPRATDSIIPSQIRVGLVVNNLDVGGLEKVVLNLIRLLSAAGHDPHLICINGAGKMFGDVGLPSEKVLVLKKAGSRVLGFSFDWSLVGAARRFIRDRDLHVVHAHNLSPLVYGGLSARLTRRRPAVVYSEHNQIYSASPAVRSRFGYYIKLADHVITVSADLKRELIDVVGVRSPVSVVRNGIDVDQVSSSVRDEVRQSWGLERAIVFGMAAVLSRQKGVTYLLKAARQVVDRLPDARFVIIGDGPLHQELARERDELGLGDVVTFTGYRNDVRRLLTGLDVYVQSSLWEGLPIVLLEALAAGRPIVATDVGGNAEVVEHQVNGLVVPPGDAASLAEAMLTLARDPGRRAEMARCNRERFEREFTSEAMLRGHLEAYREALQR